MPPSPEHLAEHAALALRALRQSLDAERELNRELKEALRETRAELEELRAKYAAVARLDDPSTPDIAPEDAHSVQPRYTPYDDLEEEHAEP